MMCGSGESLRSCRLPEGLILIADGASHRVHYALRDLCHVVGRLGVLRSLRQHFFFRVASRLKAAAGHQIVATKDFCHDEPPCGMPEAYLAASYASPPHKSTGMSESFFVILQVVCLAWSQPPRRKSAV